MEVGQYSGGYFIAEHYNYNGDSRDFSDVSVPRVNSCKMWCGTGLGRLSYFRNEHFQRNRYKSIISVEFQFGALQKD